MKEGKKPPYRKFLSIDHRLLGESIFENRRPVLLTFLAYMVISALYAGILFTYGYDPYRYALATIYLALSLLSLGGSLFVYLTKNFPLDGKTVKLYVRFSIPFQVLGASLSSAATCLELYVGATIPVCFFIVSVSLLFLFLTDPWLSSALSALGCLSIVIFGDVLGLITDDDIFNFALFGLFLIIAAWARCQFIADSREKRLSAARLSLKDDLTSLGNRRKFELDLEQAIHSGLPFSLVMADLDGLKSINDERGHLAGDELIKETASALGKRFEQVYRYGGDEFIVIANPHEQKRLKKYLLEIKEAVDRLGGSLSFGSHPHVPGSTRDEVIEGVDRHLYESKARGKGLYNGEELTYDVVS